MAHLWLFVVRGADVGNSTKRLVATQELSTDIFVGPDKKKPALGGLATCNFGST
jgi:hypothetical protein